MKVENAKVGAGEKRASGPPAGPVSTTRPWLRRVERLALLAGLLLIAVYAAAWIHRTVSGRDDVERFREAQLALRNATEPEVPGSGPAGSSEPSAIDFTLWSESRIRHYEETLRERLDPPLALLRIPSIDLEVPVHDGEDELTLNRAVGRIDGTALPGEPGNLGIAGHRDGFFRGLKDVKPEDLIELETLSATYRYRVDELLIVDPTDTEVLDPTAEPAITLVTCYPFYYVGSAPRRFIVRATLADASP
jgi:sortase A